MKKTNPPAARGNDFAPAYNKVRSQPAKTKRLPQLVKKIASQPAKTAPAKAILASNYIRQYGDKGYVPSNGIGVGGSKTGEPKQLLKKITPLPVKQFTPLNKAPIKKKQYAPSNAGYSNFA